MTNEQKIDKVREVITLLDGLSVHEAQDILYTAASEVSKAACVSKDAVHKIVANMDDGSSNPPGGPGTPP